MVPPPDGNADSKFRDEDDEGGEEGQQSFFASLLAALRGWIDTNRLRAILIAGMLVFSGLLGLTAVFWHISNIRNRPTLEDAVLALDYGGFTQARLQAETVLQYAGAKDYATRGGALYVMGVATCLSADLSSEDDKAAAYLSAGNYLQQSLDNGFLRGRQQEGYFYLGKSLYMAGELARCRGPLISALELGAEDQKAALWYLANASFYAPEPDFDDALRYASLYRKWPTTTLEESREGDLLECLILLQKGELELARKVIASVPDSEAFRATRRFIAGRILMEEGRRLAAQANELERLPDPTAAFRKLEEDRRKEKPGETDKPGETTSAPPLLDAAPRLQPISDTEKPHAQPRVGVIEEINSEGSGGSGAQAPLNFPAESPVSLPLPRRPQPPPILPPGATPETPGTTPGTAPGAGGNPDGNPNENGAAAPTPRKTQRRERAVVQAAWNETGETSEWAQHVALMQRRVPGDASEESPLLRRRTPEPEKAEKENADRQAEKAPDGDNGKGASPQPPDMPTDSPRPGTPQPEKPTEATEDDAVMILPDEEPASPFPPRRPDAEARPAPEQAPARKPEPAIESLPDEEQLRLMIRDLRNQAIHKYEQAVEMFRETSLFDDMPLYWTRQATLYQGGCFEELAALRPGNDLTEARQSYQELIDGFPSSSEAVAASFLIAEILQRRGDAATAFGAYQRAFEKLRDNPGYANNFLTKTAMFERAASLFSQLIARDEFEQAFTMLTILRPVMPEERTLRLGAVALNRWAEMLRNKADAARFDERETGRKQAEEKYRLAGAWFADLARYRFAETDYDTCLWNSAENFRAGRDYRKSIFMFRKYLGANFNRQHAEVKYALGEMYFELDRLDDAVAVLKQGMEDHPRSPLIPWMRLVQSKAYREQKNWKEAERLLQQNLNGEFAPQSTIFRDSLYALGQLRFDADDDDRAIIDLEDALSRHPDAPQAAEAHYLVARSYWNKIRSIEKTIRETTLQRTKDRLALEIDQARGRILDHYRQCEKKLRQRQDNVNLTTAEQLMLRNALFGAGAESMNLKRFEDAIFAYNLAATQYQDTTDALTALLQITLAYRQLAARAANLATTAREQNNATLAETETRNSRHAAREAIAAINRAKSLRERLRQAGAFRPDERPSALEWDDMLRIQEELTKKLFTREE